MIALNSDVTPTDNKQLLDECEHDIKNYPDQGQCYLPKPKAEVDNIDRGLINFLISCVNRIQ